MEIDDELEDFIRQQFARSPYGDRISLHIGDIDRIASRLDGDYDMVYFDGNKRTYLESFLHLLPMVRPGGFIIADNTLWDGKVTDPEHNHDAQTQGICAFNDYVAASEDLLTVILPLRDGLTLIRKLR